MTGAARTDGLWFCHPNCPGHTYDVMLGSTPCFIPSAWGLSRNLPDLAYDQRPDVVIDDHGRCPRCSADAPDCVCPEGEAT